MITPDQERCARILGVFLALLVAAYWREFHKGGVVLVVKIWLGETLYHLHRYVKSIQPPSEDWISTRINATRLASGRYWRARIARRARMKRYGLTWLAKPRFQDEAKAHAKQRIAAVARRGH